MYKGFVFVMGLFVTQTCFADTASDTVARLQQGTINILQSDEAASFEARYAGFMALVKETHDMQGITRLAVHRIWPTLAADQQEQLVSLLTRLSAATYASRFKEYRNQQFSIVDEQAARGVAKVVNALLTVEDGKTISFTYLLKPVDGHWRIGNIMVDGVSDLALKRAEYREYLANGGYHNLVLELEKQIGNINAQ